MIKVLYLAIAILAFVEAYSVGVLFLAKKAGEKGYLKCLIPFYAFYVTNRLTGIFKVFTIPVQKLHGTLAIVSAVSLLAMTYACWGEGHLPAESAPSLWQIMGVVLILCGLLFWTAMLESSRKIFRRFNVKREGLATVLSAFIVTIPFLYVFFAQKNTPRALNDMY